MQRRKRQNKYMSAWYDRPYRGQKYPGNLVVSILEYTGIWIIRYCSNPVTRLMQCVPRRCRSLIRWTPFSLTCRRTWMSSNACTKTLTLTSRTRCEQVVTLTQLGAIEKRFPGLHRVPGLSTGQNCTQSRVNPSRVEYKNTRFEVLSPSGIFRNDGISVKRWSVSRRFLIQCQTPRLLRGFAKLKK